MLKTFPIDFVRQILEQKLLEEHMINVNLFGGKEQVAITSFYEQLKSQDEVDRFIETYRDLTEQQNRTGLILNGVILSPENPTITNLYSSLIVPMDWTCSLRCTLGNRDDAIITINNLIEKLKGRKIDVAQLNCVDENNRPYTIPFCVGTIGQNSSAPELKDGDYIGTLTNANAASTRISEYTSKGVIFDTTKDHWFYCQHSNKLKVIYYKHGNQHYNFIEDDGEHKDIIFPPEHTSFEQYKVSLSFDAIRCDEPRNLNEKEYCELSFGGSATLVSKGVKLGNDLIKIAISKLKVEASTDIEYATNLTYLEPLEMPSGNNLSNQVNQLMSAKFLTKPHADSITPTLQYTFILDETNPLLNAWFRLARYGYWSLSTANVDDKISPNTEYGVTEIWSSWGNYNKEYCVTKKVENIDIDNTESDTLTISVSFQVVGNE